MTSATGSAGGFTLVELTMVTLILGLLTALAWPAVRKPALGIMLRSDARRLATALRHAREEAVLDGAVVSLDVTPYCGRLTPSASRVSFFPDGTADSFSARADGGDVAVELNSTGRIGVHEAR